MMDIGIDLRVLGGGSYGGIAQYLLGLLPELFRLDKKIKFKLFFNAYQKKLENYDWLQAKNVQLFQFNFPNRLLFASSRFFDYPKLDRLVQGADVFFSPHFFSAPLSTRCQSVVTFHDLSFMRYPEFFSWRENIWHRLEMNPRRQAQKADRIIAVSQSTKIDLIKLFEIPEEKIKVVYSGVKITDQGRSGYSFCEPARQKLCTPKAPRDCLSKDFFLFLGTLEPRKNVLGILKAFTHLKSAGQLAKESALVIAGPKGWLYQEVMDFYKHSSFKNSIYFIGPVKEEEKFSLLKSARVFVYPSFFEGFGFPPLEAMACGTPVVTSRVSSLPEVAGDSAILIDPYNIREIAEAMKNLFLDGKLREFYIQKGLERVKKFSWKETAEKTLEVLTSAQLF